MSNASALREHLVWLLEGGNAHLSFDDAIEAIPEPLRGVRPHNVPHTLWRLLEHMRICQWDILEFSRNPLHVSPEFPQGYWPPDDAPTHPAAWERCIEDFRSDLQAMIDLIQDPERDLTAPFPHGDGQTLLREALLLADHNAYHLGQIVIVRRALGCWDRD